MKKPAQTTRRTVGSDRRLNLWPPSCFAACFCGSSESSIRTPLALDETSVAEGDLSRFALVIRGRLWREILSDTAHDRRVLPRLTSSRKNTVTKMEMTVIKNDTKQGRKNGFLDCKRSGKAPTTCTAAAYAFLQQWDVPEDIGIPLRGVGQKTPNQRPNHGADIPNECWKRES